MKIEILNKEGFKKIEDKNSNISITRLWKKGYKTDTYEVLVDTDINNWMELVHGINGYPDPLNLIYPSLLDIGIMGHCSNSCSFCYQGDSINEHMSFEMFKIIIDQSKLFVNQIALGGRGDPNLHPEFERIIKYCNECKILPNYTTSGNSFNESHLKISKGCGAVAVSDYKQDFTYQTLNMLMDSDIETNIHYVINKNNFIDAMNILSGKDIWEGKVNLEKLNAIIFLKFKPQGRGKELDWDLSNDQFQQFSEKIKNLKEENLSFKIGLDSCMINTIKSRRELSPMEKVCTDTCEASRMSAYITEKGNILPCSFGDHNQGKKIKKNNIYSIWNNDILFRKTREFLNKNSNGCPYDL